MKIILVRREDYWIFPLYFVGVFFTAAFLFMGSTVFRPLAGLIGFSALLFTSYITRKNYGAQLSAICLFICLISAILLAVGTYYLTN